MSETRRPRPPEDWRPTCPDGLVAAIKADTCLKHIAPNERLSCLLKKMAGKTHLDKAEVYEIARVKSPRRAARVDALADECGMRTLTGVALADNDLTDGQRSALLASIPGVGIPTASAILTWCQPSRYAVIDFRVWETLRHFDAVPSKRIAFTSFHYQGYSLVINELSAQTEMCPFDLDRWLWEFHRNKIQNSGQAERGRAL